MKCALIRKKTRNFFFYIDSLNLNIYIVTEPKLASSLVTADSLMSFCQVRSLVCLKFEQFIDLMLLSEDHMD